MLKLGIPIYSLSDAEPYTQNLNTEYFPVVTYSGRRETFLIFSYNRIIVSKTRRKHTDRNTVHAPEWPYDGWEVLVGDVCLQINKFKSVWQRSWSEYMDIMNPCTKYPPVL